MYVAEGNCRYYVKMISLADGRLIDVDVPGVEILLWVILEHRISGGYHGPSKISDINGFSRDDFGTVWYIKEDRLQHCGWCHTYNDPHPSVVVPRSQDWENMPLVRDPYLKSMLLSRYLSQMG